MNQRKLEALTAEIIGRHSPMMTFSDVSAEIGMRNKIAVHAFLEGLPVYRVSSRRRWMASDVARRILESEEPYQ